MACKRYTMYICSNCGIGVLSVGFCVVACVVQLWMGHCVVFCFVVLCCVWYYHWVLLCCECENTSSYKLIFKKSKCSRVLMKN